MLFHENLKRICNDKGTTPTAVIRELGLSTSKIAAWNQGSLPKQEVMAKLADYLHCSVMDFFRDDDEIIESHTEEPHDDDEADILKLFRSLDRRDRHSFMAMVYDFADKIETKGMQKERMKLLSECEHLQIIPIKTLMRLDKLTRKLRKHS